MRSRSISLSSSSRRDPLQTPEVECVEAREVRSDGHVNNNNNNNNKNTTSSGHKNLRDAPKPKTREVKKKAPAECDKKRQKRPRLEGKTTRTRAAGGEVPPVEEADEHEDDFEAETYSEHDKGYDDEYEGANNQEEDDGDEGENQLMEGGETRQTEADFFSQLVQCGAAMQASCLLPFPTPSTLAAAKGDTEEQKLTTTAAASKTTTSLSPSAALAIATPTLTWPLTTAFQTTMWYLLRYADAALTSHELAACQKVLELTRRSSPALAPGDRSTLSESEETAAWRHGTDASELLLRLCYTHANKRPLWSSLSSSLSATAQSGVTHQGNSAADSYYYYVFSRSSLQAKLGSQLRLEEALQCLEETEFITNDNDDKEVEEGEDKKDEADKKESAVAKEAEMAPVPKEEEGNEHVDIKRRSGSARPSCPGNKKTEPKVYLSASRILTRYDGAKLAELFVSQQQKESGKSTFATSATTTNAMRHSHKSSGPSHKERKLKTAARNVYADRCLLFALLNSLRTKALKDFATALRLVYTRLLLTQTAAAATAREPEEGQQPPRRRQPKNSRPSFAPPQTQTISSFFVAPAAQENPFSSPLPPQHLHQPLSEECEDSVMVLSDHSGTRDPTTTDATAAAADAALPFSPSPLRTQTRTTEEASEAEEAEVKTNDNSFIILVPSRKRDLIEYLMQGHFKLKVPDAETTTNSTTGHDKSNNNNNRRSASSFSARSAALDAETDAYYIERVWKEYIAEEFYVLHRKLKETIYSLGELFQVITLQHGAPSSASSPSVSLCLSLPAARDGSGGSNPFAFPAAAAMAGRNVYSLIERVPTLLMTRPQHMWAYYFGLLASLARCVNTTVTTQLLTNNDALVGENEQTDVEANALKKYGPLRTPWEAFSSLPPWWRGGGSTDVENDRDGFSCVEAGDPRHHDDRHRIRLFTSPAELRAYRAALSYFRLLLPLSPQRRGVTGAPLTPLQRRQVKDRAFLLTIYQQIRKAAEDLAHQRERKSTDRSRRGSAQTIDTVLTEKGLLAEHLLYFTPLYRYCSCLELLFPILQTVKLYEEANFCLQFLLHTPVHVLSSAGGSGSAGASGSGSCCTFSFFYRPHKKGHYYHRWAQNLIHLKQKENAFCILKAFHEKSILPHFQSYCEVTAASTNEKQKAKNASLYASPSFSSSSQPFKKARLDAGGKATEAFPTEEVQRAMHLYVQQVYQQEEQEGEAGASPLSGNVGGHSNKDATYTTADVAVEAEGGRRCSPVVEKTFPPSVQRRARFLKSLWPSTASGSSALSRSSPLAMFHSILEYLYLDRYCACADRIAIEKTLSLLAKPFYKWTPIPARLFCYCDSLWRNKGNGYLPRRDETHLLHGNKNKDGHNHETATTTNQHGNAELLTQRKAVEEVHITGTRGLCTLHEEASRSTLYNNNNNGSGTGDVSHMSVPGGVWRGVLQLVQQKSNNNNNNNAPTIHSGITSNTEKSLIISGDHADPRTGGSAHTDGSTNNNREKYDDETNAEQLDQPRAVNDDISLPLFPPVTTMLSALPAVASAATFTGSSTSFPPQGLHHILTAGGVEEYALAVLLHQLNQPSPRSNTPQSINNNNNNNSNESEYIWRGLHCEGAWFRLLANVLLWDIYSEGAYTTTALRATPATNTAETTGRESNGGTNKNVPSAENQKEITRKGSRGNSNTWLWLTALQEGQAPLDRITSSCLFLQRRRAAVTARLDECANMSKAELLACIQRVLAGGKMAAPAKADGTNEEGNGKETLQHESGANSSSPISPTLTPVFAAAASIPLLEMVAAAPQAPLLALLRRTHLSLLSEGFSSQLSFSGFPDLVVWRARRETAEAVNPTTTGGGGGGTSLPLSRLGAPSSPVLSVLSASHLTDFRLSTAAKTTISGTLPPPPPHGKHHEEETEGGPSFFLFEVKGPGDSLSAKQMVILDALRRDGFDARVALVHDEGSSEATRPSGSMIPSHHHNFKNQNGSNSPAKLQRPVGTAPASSARAQGKTGADATTGDSGVKRRRQGSSRDAGSKANKAESGKKESEVFIL